MKVLEIIRFYSLEKIIDYIKKSNEYPRHHLWCYDKIAESGNEVGEVVYNKNSILSKIGNKLRIRNLEQQIRCLKKSRDFDIIYAPFINDIFLLALLKVLRLYTKPIVAISDHVIHINEKNRLKKIVTRFSRFVYLNGVDKILFINEKTFKGNLSHGKMPPQHGYVKSFGPDLDFFQSFVLRQQREAQKSFIFSTGGDNRDYETIIKAFQELKMPLRIALKMNFGQFKSFEHPNIIIDDSIHPSYSSTAKLRQYYYDSYAVGVPIKNKREKGSGLTVILEAMAMGKPIITTQNEFHTFDVENENIGLNVDFGDVEGWRKAVNYLLCHPEEAQKKGEQGLYLCKTMYNYNLFSQEMIRNLKNITCQNELNQPNSSKTPMVITCN